MYHSTNSVVLENQIPLKPLPGFEVYAALPTSLLSDEESRLSRGYDSLFFYVFVDSKSNLQGCANTMADLPNLSNSPEDKKEISSYLSWNKDFIALAKKNIQIKCCSYFSKKTYVVGLIRSASMRRF